MASQPTIPPIPPQAFTDPRSGRLTREAYRYLFQLNQKTSDAAAGEVATPSGSGLTGGGQVADGISLSIADNGVTNAKFRQSLGCSVVGRYANSTGNVSDIVAVSDPSVLMRVDNQLVFEPRVDGVAIGEIDAAPSVTTDAFRLNQTPTAETITPTHTITISVDGTDYKIPIVAA